MPNISSYKKTPTNGGVRGKEKEKKKERQKRKVSKKKIDEDKLKRKNKKKKFIYLIKTKKKLIQNLFEIIIIKEFGKNYYDYLPKI